MSAGEPQTVMRNLLYIFREYLRPPLGVNNCYWFCIFFKEITLFRIPKLFEATTINSMTLKNRFVRSATWEGIAKEDGSCSPKLIDLMEKLAQGNIGLIVSGYAFVSREGQAAPFQL